MSSKSRSNAGRWLLAIQALVFFVMGGFQLWTYPAETCPYMAQSRAIAEARIECPDYSGDHPVFEMYTFSLGKHITMIGIVFTCFAVLGRSKMAIQAGLIYVPVALLADWIPPVTWLNASGASTSLVPPISWAALISCVLCAAGLALNARHSEWAGDAGRAAPLRPHS
jgi:hypothetical protein